MRNIRFYDYIPLAANTLYWQFLIKSGRYGNKVHRQVNISGDTVTTEFQGREIVFVLQSETQQEILNAIDVTYHQKLYGNIDVKDKIVIDIGANIGDTAVLFARGGASHVYGFEASPASYHRAVRNLSLIHI